MSEEDVVLSDEDLNILRISSDDETWELLVRLESIRSTIEGLKEEARTVTMTLERRIPKTAIYTDDFGTEWRATVVRPDDKVTVNLDLLRTYDPELFEAVTRPALDSKALKRAFKGGRVTQRAAQAMVATPSSPSVRLTANTEPFGTEDEESPDDHG